MTSFATLSFGPIGRYGPRDQVRYELLFISSGSLSVSIDGTEYKGHAGQIILLKPGHRVCLKPADWRQSRQSVVALEKELIPASLIPSLAMVPTVIQMTEEMNALLDVALSLPGRAAPMTSLMLEHVALALLVAYVRHSDALSPHDESLPSAVLRSLEFMENNLADQMSLSEVAVAACVTPHHLIKLFRKHLKRTPVKFLWHLRLQKGSELLRTTVLDVGEIAYRIGFQSPFHFSRSFKSVHGVSPRAFRETTLRSEPTEGMLPA